MAGENEAVMSDELAGCPSEEQLLLAISSEERNQWSQHVECCAACQSLVLVIGAIRHEGGRAQGQAQLPSAQWTLFQAEIRRRRDGAHRATLPLAMAGRFGFIAGLVAVLAAWYWTGSSAVGGTGSLSVGAGTGLQSPGLLIAVASVPVVLLVMLVLQILWAED